MHDARGLVCSYLGSLEDPDAFWPDPSLANRCYALGSPTSIEPAEQTSWCLGGGYSNCPRWRSARLMQMQEGVGYPVAARRPLSPASLMRIIILGLTSMMVILACAAGLVFFQVRGSRLERSGTSGALPLAPLLPTDVATVTPFLPEFTTLPTSTNTATMIPSPTFTDTSLPTWTPTILPTEVLPPVWPTSTPLPPPPPPPPTFTPRATNTLPPPPTPRPTFTRPPTFTPFPTFTRPPTFTVTPSRTPTVMAYKLQLTAGGTSAQMQAGQTASFSAILRNLGTGTDTVDIALSPALLAGWSASFELDGADRGMGPVTISLPPAATKTITVRITVGASAQPGDVSEAYLSATSRISPTASASLAFSVVARE